MSVVPPARTLRWAGTEDARCDRGSSLVVDVGLPVIVGVRSNGGHLAAPPGLRRPAAGRRPAEGRCLDSVYKVLSAPRGAIRPSGGGRTPPLACRSRSVKLGAA